MQNMEKYPQKNKSDKILEGIHAGAQLIPLGIGGAISSLVNSFWPAGFEKRKESWLQCVNDKLIEMPGDIAKQTQLFFDTEEGKSLLVTSAMAVLSTHKEQKLKAIRDVLLNAVNDEGIHYDDKELFVHIITRLEPYDIVILKFINAFSTVFDNVESYENALLFCKEQGFEGSQDNFLIILNKLKDNSLIRVSDHIDGFGDVYSPDVVTHGGKTDMPKIKITEMGIKLMSYITDT